MDAWGRAPIQIFFFQKIVELISEQLRLEKKEVVWMVEAKEKRRNREKMGECERENAATKTNNQNWQLLTREVETLIGQNTEIIHQNDALIAKMTGISKRIKKLEEEAMKEIEKKM